MFAPAELNQLNDRANCVRNVTLNIQAKVWLTKMKNGRLVFPVKTANYEQMITVYW